MSADVNSHDDANLNYYVSYPDSKFMFWVTHVLFCGGFKVVMCKHFVLYLKISLRQAFSVYCDQGFIIYYRLLLISLY